MSEKNNIIYDDQFWDEFRESFDRVSSQPLKEKQEKKKNDCDTILIFYRLFLERTVFWSSRNEYFLLVRDFVNKKIDGFEFQRAFMELRYANMKKVRQLLYIIEDGENQNQIPDFYYSPKSISFQATIEDLFYEVEEYLSPECPEGLRCCLQKEFLPILERLTIDLDQLIDRSYNILYITALTVIGFVLVNLNR